MNSFVISLHFFQLNAVNKKRPFNYLKLYKNIKLSFGGAKKDVKSGEFFGVFWCMVYKVVFLTCLEISNQENT